LAKRRDVDQKERVFVLDTSVLVYSASSISCFGTKSVFLCPTVLEELDTFKTGSDERARNSRLVSRMLHDLREKGNLLDGIKVNDKGGKLFFYVDESLAPEFPTDKADHRILGVCKNLSRTYSVVLITKDINLALKADVIGISARDFAEDNTIKQVEELYSGFIHLDAESKIIDSLYSSKIVQFNTEGLFPNQYVLLKDISDPKHTVMARVRDVCSLQLVKEKSAWGITPRNLQQTFALDMLLDDSIPLVTLSGLAGSGKTVISVAAGLQKVVEERKYKSLVITRPVVSVGKQDLGFLPGNIMEKFSPWLQPIRDAVEILFSTNSQEHFDDMIQSGIVKVEPLCYIRGRSFHDSLIVLDESQNLSRHEVKTFLTRAGDNTKVIMTGDIYQIDSPYIDSVSNGLTQTIERFKNETLSGHISLIKGERSTLATRAAELL
jgi:PhoH-like ATPase